MMIWKHHAREADFALDAVRRAAGLCRAVRDEASHASLQKPDASPVTEADYVSQALIAGRLAEEFPRDSLVAEEEPETLAGDPALLQMVVRRLWSVRPDATAASVQSWLDRGAGPTGDRFWALDPIDGTKGFLRGDQYVVALALIEAGQVMVAALAAPALGADLRPVPSGRGCVVVAVRGEGAWVAPLDGGGERRLAVSACSVPSEARLVWSFEDDHGNPAQMGRILERLHLTASIRMDSQAKYLLVAGGQADLLIRLLPERLPSYREKLWDVAAGLLVVEEAGGRVTDLDGRPLDLSAGRELTRNRGGLVTNGHLHEPVLAAVQSVLAEGRA